MKKKTIRQLVLIAICIGILLGYQAWDRIRTDSVPPVIRFDDQIPECSVTDNDTALLFGITATDNVDTDVTDSLVIENIRIVDPGEGLATIHVAAFDRSGNVAKAQRQIRYSDYVSPRFSLSKPLIFTVNSNVDVLNFISANDVIDGDITSHIRATTVSDSSIAVAGTHDVEFRITNSLGDNVELILPVETMSANLFEAGLTLTDYLIYLDVGESFNPHTYLDTYTLSRMDTSLKNGLPANFRLETEGTVNTQVPGVYAVGYKVICTRSGTAGSTSQTYTGYSKLIVVVEG